MKEVLLSIQPKWCKKIASGEKTIEVRKTRSNLEIPFKCFIYCTKSGEGLLQTGYSPMHVVGRNHSNIQLGCYKSYNFCKERWSRDCVNGKVIGEFVCDKVDIYPYGENGISSNEYWITGRELKQTCLSYSEVKNYGKGKTLYGWHISDLKIYDNPKDLGEFTVPCKKGFDQVTKNCKGCRYAFKGITSGKVYCDRVLIRPPQSWCYVEESEEEE